jgi:hypothetical protein
MGGVHLSRALRRAHAKRCHSADRHLRSELRKSICSTSVASGQSCRVWRTLEEAATPGQPAPRRNAFLEGPSRQFTLENYQEPPALPQCSGRARRTSRFDFSTLRFARSRFKQKSAPHCAETVDAGDSLWKALEKSGGISRWARAARHACRENSIAQASASRFCRDTGVSVLAVATASPPRDCYHRLDREGRDEKCLPAGTSQLAAARSDGTAHAARAG